MTVEEAIARYSPALEQELKSIVQDRIAGNMPGVEPLYGMLNYHLGWADENLRPTSSGGGKRIRPTLCLLSCEACGAEFHRALSVAASIELLHNFTLIHDDIQDRSVQRRHRPSVWVLWGDAQALNAGDALYSVAALALLRAQARGVPAAITLAASEILHHTLLSVCEGQYLDIAFEQSQDVTTDLYLAMIARKTAELIGCSAQLGAYVATGDLKLASLYRDFGRAMGMAFQIQDDILGIWGQATVTGKPVGDDIFHRKKTLPVLFALEQAGQEDKAALEEILFREEASAENVERATGILSRLGAKEHAEERAREWLEQALATLEKANPRDAAGAGLRQLAESLVGRSS